MKKQIVFLVLTIFSLSLFVGCAMQRITMLETFRVVPYSNVTETFNPKDSITTKVTVISWDTLKFKSKASSQSPLALGYVPTLSEMAAYEQINGNAEVSRAMAQAIDKNPNNIQILEKVPNPANPNDLRLIFKGEFLGSPYYYNQSGRSVWYNGQWIPTRTFEIFRKKGESPTPWIR
jgi:hypothetical protein